MASLAHQDEGKFKKQFEFINLSNKPQITDAGARKLVRAHAMRDFRRRKVPREPCDNQGFVQKSSLDIARAIKPLESHHPRGELSDEEVKRGSSDDQVGDSPLLAGAPTWSEDGQDSPPQQGDGPKQIKAATVKPSRNSARQAKKQSKRSQMGRQLSSPTTSSSSDSDFPQSPQTSQAQNGKRSDGFEMIARSPGAWSADPFDALPIPSTERVRILMHHYIQIFIQAGTPMISPATWFDEALKDSALFKATLLPSALHRAVYYEQDLTESFDLFNETTRVVKGKLDDPVLGISDTNIAAVICLSFFENVLGNIAASNVHMEGMRRMVELRGGPRALGLKGILQRMVSWADIWNSMLALSTPRFPPLETPNTRLSLKCPIPEWEAQYSDDTKQEDDSTSLLVSTGQGEFQNDITNVFQGLQQLSRTLAAVRSSKTKHLDALVFIDKVLVLERQLLLSLISNDLPHTSPLDTFILQSCTHAAFIYIYSTLHTTIRDLPLRSPFFGILIGRLRTALDHSGFLLAWSHTNPIMLLWVLVVGAAAAYRRPQRPWFVTQLTGVCAILNIQGLEEMRLSLRKMMWVDGALDSTLKDLWPELQFQWG